MAGYGGLRLVGKSHRYALWTAAFATMAIGMLKEITDSSPDGGDLEANLAGTGAGMIIPVLLHEW